MNQVVLTAAVAEAIKAVAGTFASQYARTLARLSHAQVEVTCSNCLGKVQRDRRARYCSAACRQKAYYHRTVKPRRLVIGNHMEA